MPRYDDLPKARRQEEIMKLFKKKQTPVLTTGDILKEFDVSRETINKDMSELLDKHDRLELHSGRGTNVYYLDDAIGPFTQIEATLQDIWKWSMTGKAYVLSVIGFSITAVLLLIVAVNVAQGNPDLAENNISTAMTFGGPSLLLWIVTTGLLRRRHNSNSLRPWNW